MLIGNILHNDIDPDLDGLTATAVTQPTNGTLTLQANGDFSYLPDDDYFGSDSFSYFASDNDDSGSAVSVSITVNPFTPDEPDLLVHYQFEDQLVAQATDSSGYKNHGLIDGSVYVNDSADGTQSSLEFDGNDDFIDAGFIDVSGPGLTLSAWFKADSYPGSSQDPRIITKATGTSADSHVFMLGTVESGNVTRLRGRIRVNGTTKTLTASGGDLVTGEWYHAASSL